MSMRETTLGTKLLSGPTHHRLLLFERVCRSRDLGGGRLSILDDRMCNLLHVNKLAVIGQSLIKNVEKGLHSHLRAALRRQEGGMCQHKLTNPFNNHREASRIRSDELR